MNFESYHPDVLWQRYQRGYTLLVRSGRYFRQILRPALSHVFFLKALPLLIEYSRANQSAGDFPPGFSEQLEANSLSIRDLLHLDYAICLGTADAQSVGETQGSGNEILGWPGPDLYQATFIAADALAPLTPEDAETEADLEGDESDDDASDDGNAPPTNFDL